MLISPVKAIKVRERSAVQTTKPAAPQPETQDMKPDTTHPKLNTQHSKLKTVFHCLIAHRSALSTASGSLRPQHSGLRTVFGSARTQHSGLSTVFCFCLLPFAFCLSSLPATAATTITLAQQYYGLGDLQCAAYSPDGKYILTGGSAGAFLWDVQTGEVVRIFTGRTRAVSSVAFSPDGTKVLTGSYLEAKLWNASDGTLLRTFSGHTHSVYSVAFSPDGTKVLTGSSTGLPYFLGEAKLWNASDGMVLYTFSGHTGEVHSVAFSPDGTKVLTGSSTGYPLYLGEAKLWNASDGALIRTFSDHTGGVYSVAFSPDGTKVLTGSSDRTAKLWNASDGTTITTFSSHTSNVTSVAFSPDGTKVLTGGDTTAKLWNVSDGTLLRTFSGHTNWIRSAAFSPDGTKVLTGAGWPDNTAKLWNASDGTVLRIFSGHTWAVYSVAFSPDETKVLTGSYLEAKLWNASDGTTITTFSGHTNTVYSVAFSPDGTKVLTGSYHEAKLWNASDGTTITTFSGHTWAVSSVAFSPDGTKVLTGSWDGTAKLWNASDGTEIRTFSGHTGEVYSVAFSPDGTKVLTGSWDNTAKLWDASNGTLLRTFSGHQYYVSSVAFSPDGTKVLTGSYLEAKLWDTSAGSVLRTFSDTQDVRSVAFSPDGTKVLTGSDDRTAKLWDASVGTVLRTFSSHAGSVSSVTFSPNGTKVLTGSGDGTARLWEIWPAKAVIVAGGGPFYGNAIAEQTKQLAAYCYKICRRRGYAPNEIQYLSAFGAQDADGDGLNDVDASATVANLHDALDRFSSDTARLFVYLVDHGYRIGNGMYFQMSPTQTLVASDLDTWLDALQILRTLHVTLIVDSCYSGNFLSACKPPTGKRRLTIASTTSDTVAVFLPPPSLTSFSYQFLGALYMGYKVQQAFDSARQFFNTLGVANQTPWLDANGDGRYTAGVDDSTTGPAAEEFFGTSWAYAAGGGWEPPAFEAVTPNQSPPLNTTVTIWVKMLPFQNPQRVWATILPPAAKPLAGQALTDLPRVELVNTSGTRWEAQFGGLDTVGTYVVAHVAQFENERITQPVYSQLNVGAPVNPPPIKAILVSGRAASSTISSQTISLANLAYRVSRHRGYGPSRIRYLSAFGNQDADGDRMNDVYSTASVANITTALSTWASSDCQRLLVYLVGPGDRSGAYAVFRLSPTEVLTSTTLDTRLDALQNTGGVEDMVVVADFPYAAEFLRGCKPPAGKRRVLIAGTDSPNAVFLAPPQCTSFSFSFLSAAHMGHNLEDSFDAADQFFAVWTGFRQQPWLDDNGDGLSNKWDGANARNLHWGYPWAFAGPEGGELPFILSAGAAAGAQLVVWANLMEGPVPQRVTATIIPPTVSYTPGRPITDFPTVTLSRQGQTWRWSATAAGLRQPGTYTILFQALYANDRLSAPILTHLTVGTGCRNWQMY